MRAGCPALTPTSRRWQRCSAAARRGGDHRPGPALDALPRACPVQPKVASSGLRLRVILRSPELPCESLAGSGRAGGMSCVTALAARVASSRSGTQPGSPRQSIGPGGQVRSPGQGGRSALLAAGQVVRQCSLARVKGWAPYETVPVIADGCACMEVAHMRILEHRPGGPGLDGSPGKGTAAGLAGTKTDRWIGMWSARVLAAFGVAYAVTMVAGFAAMGTLRPSRCDTPQEHEECQENEQISVSYPA
jgi:hypothetical protein